MPAPANLVHQTSTTTGTGDLTLVALNGKQSFDTAFGTGSATDVFDYFISNQGAPEWERGTGHMSVSATLVRDTVIESTNSNAAVSFSAGTKDVVNDIPAARQYYNGGPLGTPASGTLTNCTGLPVSGITASTSAALGIGSLELGHATDTTLARIAAGRVSVEGNEIGLMSSGSWTPGILINGVATGITYSAQSGAYVKLGSIALCWGHITLSSKGSQTGSVVVTGTPFNFQGTSGSGLCIYYAGFAALSSPPIFTPTGSNSRLYVRHGSATGASDVTDANLTNTSDFYIVQVGAV